MFSYRRTLSILTVLTILLLLSTSSKGVAQLTERSMQPQPQNTQPDSNEVSDLLNQARSEANQLRADASEMESFTRSNLDWQTEASKINQIKEDVNAVGRTLAKLRDEEAMASDWQKTAIERITPLLQELASTTTSVINHLNKDHGRNLNSQEHRDMLKLNADLSADLATVVADFVDYGKTKTRFYELRQKLELSETSGQ